MFGNEITLGMAQEDIMEKIEITTYPVEIIVWRKPCNTGNKPALYEIVGYPNNREVTEEQALDMQQRGLATIRRAVDGTDFG